MAKKRNNCPKEDNVCSICCEQVNSSDCELVEGTLLEVLEVVLIKLNFTNLQPVICKNCSKKLLNAFEHKSKWIYTEDRLYPYVNSAIDGHVDIKTVFLNENDCKQSDVKPDTQICRLCMEMINDKSWNELLDVLEKQYSLETFEKYAPELNLNATENPIICKSCLDSLSVFMDFITFYQGQEVKTEDYFEVDEDTKLGSTHPALIEDLERNKTVYNSEGRIGILKCSEYQHKPNDKTRRPNQTKQRAKQVNIENHLLAHQMKNLKCKTCNFRTNDKHYLKKHEMRHKIAVETPVFKCAHCSYATKRRRDLQHHIFIHKPFSAVELFKCEFCTYETKCKAYLSKHLLVHKPLSEVKVFKCDFCSYVTRYKHYARLHYLVHNPISNVEIFKCEFCSYKTKRTGDLRRHIQTHKPLSEVEVFKCECCSFETKHKRYLPRHMLIHKPFSEVEVFKCGCCSYETKLKRYLSQHVLIHKLPSQVEVLKCEFCSFETNRKSYLRRHLMIHKRLSKETFKCKYCSYQNKYNYLLKRHLRTHN